MVGKRKRHLETAKIIVIALSFSLIICGCHMGDTEVSSAVESSTVTTKTSEEASSETSSGTYSIVPFGKAPIDSTVNSWINEKTDVEDLNAGDYDDIITKTYPADYFYKYNFERGTDPTYSMLYGFPDEIEYECYRRPSDDVIYAITKLEDGTLIYSFYVADNFGFSPGYAVAASKKLSSADFENITVGSTIDEVADLEPIAKKMLEVSSVEFTQDYEWMHTSLLLTDGFLRLEYRRNNSGQYIVSKKALYSDFKYPYVFSADGEAYEYDYTILEKDYPKN